jgi:ABC-type bacteriocin/lantibiotic exporter with double-glycine peptidase domain
VPVVAFLLGLWVLFLMVLLFSMVQRWLIMMFWCRMDYQVWHNVGGSDIAGD